MAKFKGLPFLSEGVDIVYMKEIRDKCNDFEIGKPVVIIERGLEGNKTIVKCKTPATVIERYPNHLVVERKSGVQESFTYKDIVLLGVLELR